MYCGQGSIVKHSGEERTLSVLRCRSWSCPDCNPDRCKRLIAEAIGGTPRLFVTLTLRADDPRSPPDRVKALSNAWRLIRLRAIRKYKTPKLPFLAVVETTQKGTPHLHILIRAKWIDQAWLSNQAAELLDAPVVDIRLIDQHRGIAKYVAKYIGKAPTKFGGCKRYWKSQDYETRPQWRGPRQRKEGDWFERRDCHLARLIQAHREMGYSIEIVSDRRAIARPPPEGFWWHEGV